MIPRLVNGHKFIQSKASINPEDSDWLVCGHCGLRSRFPENTMACTEQA